MSKKVKNLLIMDGDKSHDWVNMFKKKKLKDGTTFNVVCGSWMDTSVCCYPDCVTVKILPVSSTSGIVKPRSIKFSPDFVIVRNQPRGPYPINDKRNALFGLIMGGVPSINTLTSIYFNLERPVVVGGLKKIQKKVGKDKFPLIPITFYGNHKEMVISPKFPCIAKISHAHRGMGKIKCDNYNVFRDVSSIVALKDMYCSCEPYIDVKYGIRVQKVGKNYRVYKKQMTGSSWKSQDFGSKLIIVKLTPEYKLWVDECAKHFDMDLLAVDAVVDKDGKHFIIELNGSPIGLMPEHWKEDTNHVIDLSIKKMNDLFCSEKKK